MRPRIGKRPIPGWQEAAGPFNMQILITRILTIRLRRLGRCIRRIRDAYHESIMRAADWLAGMQSRNGGFAAFDSDNTYYYLNEIPFADHGALLDPPTSDVTARCTGFLALYGAPRHKHNVERGLEYLFREQEPSGAWFGRWGSNYIYGTWSVLEGLRLARVDMNHLAVRRAVQWLKSVQRDDGGWGEGNDTYLVPAQAGQFEQSTSFQTAWAVLGTYGGW